jgi:undecaprenyl-diphosphatase
MPLVGADLPGDHERRSDPTNAQGLPPAGTMGLMSSDPDTGTGPGIETGPDPGTDPSLGTGPGPGPGPEVEPVVDRALAETPEQDYVGTRDLTLWPTAIGRFVRDLTLRAARRIAPDRLLAITLAVGLGLVAVLTALAADVYDSVAESDGISGLDRPALDAALAVRTTTGERVITAYTHLGGPVEMPILTALVVVGLAVIWRQWTPIVLTAVTGLGSLLLTVVGKAMVGRSRPPLVDAVPPFETSFSFPSGHALNSMALAGIVAYLLIRRQRTAWARTLTITLALTFALTMGLSRVYLGHHWMTDVLVAWTLALAWLTVVITAHRLFITVRRRKRSYSQLT